MPADYTAGLTAFEMRSLGQVRSEAANLQKEFSDWLVVEDDWRMWCHICHENKSMAPYDKLAREKEVSRRCRPRVSY